MNSIYALVDPRNNELRYIGKSRDPEARLKSHYYGKNTTHCSHWVRSLRRSGVWPQMIVIEKGLSEDEWPVREQFWIQHYKGLGANLTNITDGGHHVVTKKRFWPGRYFPLSKEFSLTLAKSKTLKGTDYRVLWFMIGNIDCEMQTYMRQSYIASELSIAQSSVSVACANLEAFGVISKVRKNGIDGFQVHPSLASRGSQKG